MDPRLHVANALARVLRPPGAWPTHDLARLRNQVLDECGGDLRTLVVFLMQLAEFGVPDALLEGAARGDASWETHRNQLALRLSSERFLLPEMTRWGVECWGVALGIPGAEITPPLPPAPIVADRANDRQRSSVSALQARPPGAHASAAPILSRTAAHAGRGGAGPGGASHAGGVAAGSRAPFAAPIPSWVKPTKVPAVARWISGSHLSPTQSPRPGVFTAAEQRALAAILMLAAAAVAVMAGTRDERTTGDPVPEAREASLSPPPPLSRRDSSALLSARTLRGLDDARVSAAARMALQGDFRLTVRRSSVHGDERCDSIASRIRWNQESVERFSLSEGGQRFEMVTRPGLGGTVDVSGEFVSRVVYGDRDGTASAFQMRGWMTPDGFRAVGETTTRTLLRWRQQLDCRFVAELDGERLHARPLTQVP